MDKIITLIIVFYIFRSLYRFLSGEQGKKKGTVRQPPAPRNRPAPSPPSKPAAGPAPDSDFPSGWREIGQVLRDLKRESDRQQEGIKTPEKLPHKEMDTTQHTKRKRDDHKGRVSVQKRMPPKKRSEEKIPPAKPKISREEGIERDYISFDQPGLLLKGIILSEILGPPMARRNHLAPPYLRGCFTK